jgi:dienelactone hydrolase
MVTTQRPRASIDTDKARRKLRCLLGDIPRPALSVADRQPITADGFQAERMTLAGGDGPIRALLAGPTGDWNALPALLYSHAHGDRHDIGASELLEGRPAIPPPGWGEVLARAGIISLCIDLPCFGERAYEPESLAAKRHLWRGTTLFGQMLAELGGAFDLLLRMDGVDPARIGVMGLSMGATLAFWLAALEPRIQAVAHICCFADLETLVASGAHDLHGPYMTVPGLLPVFRTGEIAGLVAPRPQLIRLGADDPLTPPAAVEVAVGDARAAYAAAGASERLDVRVEPGVDHRETPTMRRDVLTFFVRELAPA